ncbi:MAG: tripartite tricarboxylate transporter substrate-binding protein, partial [Betaproteobacteria bacterium]
MQQYLFLHKICATLLAIFVGISCFAQSTTSTSTTIKIIVPFTPGTGMDTIARTIQPRLAERTGQTVLVQNMPGASGNIGADFVAKSAPDGTTLLMGANTMLIASQLYKNT